MIKGPSHEVKEESGELPEEKQQTWKDVLLGDGPRFELPLPKRGKAKTSKQKKAGENLHS